jgi:WD40 repeat protein
MVVVAPHEAPGQVWQVAPAFRLVATLPTDFSGLTFIAASPDGKLVATGGADTTIRIYDTATWKTLHELRQFTVEPFAGAFTPNSKYLLVGGADNQITLLDPLTGKEGRKFTASKDVVAEIHPLGDNARVIAVQWDADGKNPAYLSIWELGKGPGKKISGARPITGGGVVKGNPWFTSASARTLQIWSGDLLVAGN